MFRSVLSHRTRTHGGNGSSERLSKQLIDLFESCVFAVRKKKILLRGVMTRKRVIHYPKIITMFNGRQKSKPFTLAQAAGHGSFVMLALSYLESDFLNLRLYAVSGVCLSILFQYYREIPLWLPISWNCLFLGINYVMIALLYKETSDAKNLTTEQRQLFASLFQTHGGMTSVDFLKLMGIAKRIEVDAGETLIHQGAHHRDVYLLQLGHLTVKRDGETIGAINKHQFTGEMSFLRWQDEMHTHKYQQSAKQPHVHSHAQSHSHSPAAVPPQQKEQQQQSQLVLQQQLQQHADSTPTLAQHETAVVISTPNATIKSDVLGVPDNIHTQTLSHPRTFIYIDTDTHAHDDFQTDTYMTNTNVFRNVVRICENVLQGIFGQDFHLQQRDSDDNNSSNNNNSNNNAASLAITNTSEAADDDGVSYRDPDTHAPIHFSSGDFHQRLMKFFVDWASHTHTRIQKAIDRVQEIWENPQTEMITLKKWRAERKLELGQDPHGEHLDLDLDIHTQDIHTSTEDNTDPQAAPDTPRTKIRKQQQQLQQQQGTSLIHKIVAQMKANAETHSPQQQSQETLSGTKSPQSDPNEFIGMRASASVICDQPAVMYVWDFMDLHELIQENPRIGLCVEMCMSADLNNKFQSQAITDNVRKYNHILTGALMNNETVSDSLKAELSAKRTKLSVGDNEHESMLKRLGWSKDQYASGNRYGQNETVQKYKALATHVLSKIGKDGLTSTDYAILREYRRANKISAEQHVFVLRELGWSLDDFEAGTLVK